ncbi:MAG: Manganese-dependent 2,3-dihydroxybiphenyl 1,2-dioxygenase [Burkholderia lata]|uniref:Manganese-dependent 2,3-dihydroxybiphenyl 1,2-dioxygenase n=1 Tax=Burkholderia lata (strain ATCC 17760 / DSM 23089 / LMG 22485 / NCIMB 9086 / R18194 / 383) TaxID=482957 RepID=A0A833PY60_BURL3|nr:VOC family protein [Burkholderia lata]KAF1039921.1 MAG: Manganese-dependent 2,3-dihydroxybiphenyl 1,2-dioxygenase [Burkholderia lata]
MNSLRPRRLGHMVLMVRDIHRSAKFYTEVMGLKVSDWIGDQMVFLRAGTDHHDLALAQLPKDSPDFDDLPRYSRPGLEHFSYLVDSIEEMERSVKVLQSHGVEIVRGIGRHGPGDNFFLVFKDPDGNNVEVYCAMEQIGERDPREPQVWERTVESFDQYRFARFVVPPPPHLVAEKSRGNAPAAASDDDADAGAQREAPKGDPA